MARHLLNTCDLTTDDILSIVRQSHSYLVPARSNSDRAQDLAEALILEQPATLIVEQPATLVNRRIVLGFFEPSTRTRLSFETAAHRLGAQTVYFQPTGSSVEKGESLRETLMTIESMGFDAIVLRHSENGVPSAVASYTRMSVINAGEGTNAHPTQALLDASALIEKYGSLKGLRICIVGDILHSRVARSNADVFVRLGAEIALCGPPGLLPAGTLNASHVFDNIDDALRWANVINLLRIQRERIATADQPSVDEYRNRYALTAARLNAFPDVCVIHPGPVNEGVETDQAVLDSRQSLVHRQVTHGVAVRMAVLNHVLHSKF